MYKKYLLLCIYISVSLIKKVNNWSVESISDKHFTWKEIHQITFELCIYVEIKHVFILSDFNIAWIL